MVDMYDVFITVDSNLEFQQQLSELPVAFIVLSARNSKLETLLSLIPKIQEALEAIQPGEVTVITETP